MPEYPLVFTLVHDLKFESGVARVGTKGRALMLFEEGEWWCHGVEPGGITASGADPMAAFVAFREAFGDVLAEIAAEAQSLAALESTIGKFVFEADAIEAGRWDRARAEIRAGKDVAAPFNNLKRVVEEFRSMVNVGLLKNFEGTDGVEVALAEALAKAA